MASGLEKICFHKDGRPRSWLRAVLMKKSGKIRPVFHRVVFKKNGNPRQRYISLFQKSFPIAGSDPKTKNNMHVNDLLNTHLSALRPLTVFGDPSEPRRITLVTDSIGASSLFGGVGTALIFAALWAKHANAQLRIVTRTERPVTSA
ncbi:MAG: hypothetical protein ACNA7Q_07285, partial [Rhodobacterales bacterium]